ncbi:phosphate-starvation-inducible PsiE family protein [uncultured Thiodictyon sp.]|uniref:phosphate-starvation-inducible PsiE family protein n=1 Tax=uncultured Thiodictyon sp. TaxID=1846217 RepID=UPI0025FB33D8|nr:phosphate-starvation-inducible PsiE family protein [uncultured Thiodictyon sp.]
MIDRLFHLYERALAALLLLLIGAVAAFAVVELLFTLYQYLTNKDGLLLNQHELFEVFGMFLVVLIAMEFMSSIYMYLKDKSLHVEMMLAIAITALTRKVVVLDSSAHDPLYLMALAALLATLVGGYYLVKRRKLSRVDAED